MKTITYFCTAVALLFTLSTSTLAEDSAPVAPADKPATAPAALPAVESAPVAVAAPKDSGTSDTVVIEYSDADIQNVLRTLAAKAQLNLVLGDEVMGKVTVHLENVTYEEAMKLIVESKGFAFLKDKNIVRVKSKELLQAEPTELKLFTLNYAKAEDIKKTLDSMLSPQGKSQIDVRSNTLVISDTPSSLAKLVPLIASLDGQTTQVMIEAKFIETIRNPHKDLGVNWSDTLLNHKISAGGTGLGGNFTMTKDTGGPSGPWMSTALLDFGKAQIVFSYLNQDTDTELLANPSVVTTDNGKAKIKITQEFPIPTFSFNEQTASFTINGFMYKDIGITLNVTPRINKDAFITLEVAPEVSSQTGTKTFSSGGSSFDIPVVDTRQAATTVLIKSGNTLAIGGLIRTDVGNHFTKVPLMGDVPVLGALFRSKNLDKVKRNLLIFLTPTIISPDAIVSIEKTQEAFEKEQARVEDPWLPHDNAKPRSFIKGWGTPPLPAPAAQSVNPSQNFGPK